MHCFSGNPEHHKRKRSKFHRKHFNDGKRKRSDVCARYAISGLAVLFPDFRFTCFSVTCPGERNQGRPAQTFCLRGVVRFRHFVVCFWLWRWLNDNNTSTTHHAQGKLHNHRERNGK
jgi:hypothetical protein